MRSPLLNVMVSAARKAGRRLARDFGEVEALQVSIKGPGDFVSEADKRAEQIIIEELQKARPAYGFVTEETGVIMGSDTSNRFIVDPLDGTTNFLHGIPHFAVSIGLERDGKPYAGVVYNPITDELFEAEHGKGAVLNDKRIRVSARTALSQAVLTTGIPHSGRGNEEAFMASLRQFMDISLGIRRFGAAALDLAYVAAGRCDGFWEYGLAYWDICAGAVLVQEARGQVFVSPYEDNFRTAFTLAGTPQIFAEMQERLKPTV